MTTTYYATPTPRFGSFVVDQVGPDGRGMYSRKTREELEAEYGTLEVIDTEEAARRTDAAATTGPREITSEDFQDALEVLPPMRWINRGGAESFRISEAISGTVHGAYVRIGERYFTLAQPLRVTHDELVAKVREAFPAVH